MSERRLYLGRVEWVSTGDRRGPIAQLRPLYEAAANLLSWCRSLTLEDALREFPNRGLVTWFNPPAAAIEGSVWQFRIEEQRSFNPGNPYHDAYKTMSTPMPAVEILDLRGVGDEERCRLQVTQEGLELTSVPAGRIYLWIDDESWVGPVRLELSNKPNRWVLDPIQQQHPLPQVRPAPTNHVASLIIDMPRLFLVPGAATGPRIAQVDWAPDEAVLKRVLRWLRRIDRAYTDKFELTERAIDRAVELLSSAGLSTADHCLELQRLRRARGVVESLAERQELVDTLIRDILQVPSIRASIEGVVDRVRQDTEDQVRAELEDSINRVAELQAEKARLDEEIAELRATLSAQVDELDTVVAQRVTELMARPGRALTELAILRAAVGLAVMGPKPGTEVAPTSTEAGNRVQAPSSLSHLAPSVSGKSREAMYLGDQAQLRQALRRAFRARSVSTRAAKMLHAAFLAGVMPVLAGSGAFKALEAYAESVTGGRWLWLPITPAILGPSDLLGQVDPAARCFLPATGGLLDLLLHARGTDELYLVVLDGINRAAVETYLTTILACYSDAWCGGRGRALPLLHPSAVSPDDPYASVPWLPWPPNVLLAGTLVDGAVSVPIPPSFWTAATLIHLDAFNTEVGAGEASARAVSGQPDSAESPTTAVSLETWRAWQGKVDAVAMPAAGWALLAAVHERGLELSPEVRVLCARVYAAERTWESGSAANGRPADDRAALESMVLQCLIPLAATDGKTNMLLEALNWTEAVTERVERALRLAPEVLA